MKKTILSLVFLLSFALLPGAANATIDAACSTASPCDAGEYCFNGKCAASTDFGVGKVESGIQGNLGTKDLVTTITDLINVGLGLLGVIAVIIVLVGGFKWMTAGGEEEKVGEARKIIIAGVTGLAIILASWAIARFVLEQLSNATGSGNVDSAGGEG